MNALVNVTNVKTTNNSAAKVSLLNGYQATDWLYEMVHDVTRHGVATMAPNTLYTAKMLCGEEFWELLPNKYWKSLAGRCFAHMVSTQQFSVAFVQYKKSRTKHYQTI